ncbi:MAG TPA: hypothetical protein VN805_15875 [Caulobacteraceae bacterium]|nr:hypothetical protein [Caulobacteraceae bacterium]
MTHSGLLGAGSATPALAAAKHSISLARLPDGWTWELIDIDGLTAAAGVAAHQKAAMGMALRAAQSLPAPRHTALADNLASRSATVAPEDVLACT